MSATQSPLGIDRAVPRHCTVGEAEPDGKQLQIEQRVDVVYAGGDVDDVAPGNGRCGRPLVEHSAQAESRLLGRNSGRIRV